VVASCESINKLYKEEFLKIKSFEEFLQAVNLINTVNKNGENLEQLVKAYL